MVLSQKHTIGFFVLSHKILEDISRWPLFNLNNFCKIPVLEKNTSIQIMFAALVFYLFQYSELFINPCEQLPS